MSTLEVDGSARFRSSPLSLVTRSALVWAAAASAAAVAIGVATAFSPWIGLGLLIVIVVSYTVVQRPLFGLLLLAVLVPVISAIRRGLPIPHLRPSEVLVVWLVPLVIIAARGRVRPWGRLEWIGLAYAGGTLVLGAFDLWRRGAPFSTSNLGVLMGPFQYLLLLRAVRVGVRSDGDRILIVRCLLLGAVPISVLALAQGFGVSAAHRFQVWLTGVDLGHLDRATGPFTNWQVLAGYLLVVGLLAAALLAWRADRILSARAAGVLLVLVGAGLARTLTIGAFAGWLVGSTALFVASGRFRLSSGRIAAGAVVGIGVLFAVFAARFKQQYLGRPSGAGNGLVPTTIADRWHIWVHQYLPALSGRWVTGFGPDLPPDATWKFTDSVYLTVLLRGGVILLAIYTSLMVAFASVARRMSARDAESRALASALFVIVVVLVPLQAIATYFTTSGLPEVLWITAAVVSTLPSAGALYMRAESS